MDRAASTAPPPGTTDLDSRTLLTTQRASCSERSISSHMKSLAPRKMMEADVRAFVLKEWKTVKLLKGESAFQLKTASSLYSINQTSSWMQLILETGSDWNFCSMTAQLYTEDFIYQFGVHRLHFFCGRSLKSPICWFQFWPMQLFVFGLKCC